jgi:hypothetical protein
VNQGDLCWRQTEVQVLSTEETATQESEGS